MPLKPRRRAKSGKASQIPWWMKYLVAPALVGMVVALFTLISKKLAEPTTGELHVICNVDSARISLNNAFKAFMQTDRSIILRSLHPGEYVLAVKKASPMAYVRTQGKRLES